MKMDELYSGLEGLEALRIDLRSKSSWPETRRNKRRVKKISSFLKHLRARENFVLSFTLNGEWDSGEPLEGVLEEWADSNSADSGESEESEYLEDEEDEEDPIVAREPLGAEEDVVPEVVAAEEDVYVVPEEANSGDGTLDHNPNPVHQEHSTAENHWSTRLQQTLEIMRFNLLQGVSALCCFPHVEGDW